MGLIPRFLIISNMNFGIYQKNQINERKIVSTYIKENEVIFFFLAFQRSN